MPTLGCPQQGLSGTGDRAQAWGSGGWGGLRLLVQIWARSLLWTQFPYL